MNRHKVRVVPALEYASLVESLRDLGVNEGGVRIMALKGVHRLLWVEGFSTKGANILKQEMLARGGEVALPHAESLFSGEKTTSCLVMGTLSQFRSLVTKLRGPSLFGLAGLADEIEVALGVADKGLRWDCRGRVFTLGERILVMGVLNVTPDSFSDGGRYNALEQAVDRAKAMLAEGAEIIDVGGESTRPGAPPVSAAEELSRVLPVVEALVKELGATVSVDTRRGEVARRVLEAGASLINDVSGEPETELLATVAEYGAGLVVMHNGRGHTKRALPPVFTEGTASRYFDSGASSDLAPPGRTGASGADLDPRVTGTGVPLPPVNAKQRASAGYSDFWADIYRALAQMLERAEAAGIGAEKVAVDPGIGFGKTVEQNLELVRGVGNLASLGRPILLGPSRKSFIGAVLDLPVEDRLEGTLACVAVGISQGAHIIRVHDVRAGARTARMAEALRGQGGGKRDGDI